MPISIKRVNALGASALAIHYGATPEAVSEALTLAAKAGVDPARVRQALLGGSAQSRLLETHGQRMLDRNFKPGFRLQLHHNDLKIALALGKEYGVALPNADRVREMMAELIAEGKGDWDNSGLVTWIEEKTNEGK